MNRINESEKLYSGKVKKSRFLASFSVWVDILGFGEHKVSI